MKPFDLEKALAGAPVVTEDGDKVLQIAHLSAAPESHRVVALIETQVGTVIRCFSEDGHTTPSQASLKMASIKKTVYMNIYRRISQINLLGDVYGYQYQSKDAAEKCASPDALAVAVPVEVDVE